MRVGLVFEQLLEAERMHAMSALSTAALYEDIYDMATSMAKIAV